MFSLLMWKLAFAGVGHLIADYSLAVVIAGALIVGSFFVGSIPFLGKLRADMLWAAAFIIGCLLWGAHIQHDVDLRWEAKSAVVQKAVKHAITKPNANPDRDKFDSDQ